MKRLLLYRLVLFCACCLILNAQTPAPPHASAHASGGSDQVTLAESQITGLVSDLAAKQGSITTGTVDQALNGTLGLTSFINCVSTGGVYQYSTSTHAFTCHTLVAGDIPNIAESQVTGLTTDLSGKQASITTGTVDQALNGTLGLTSYVNCVSTGGVYQYSTSTHAFTCHTLIAADIPNIAESQVTGLVSDLAAKQASITTGTTDQLLNGTLGLKSLVDCVSTGGVYQYSTSTHAFTCHTLVSADIPQSLSLTGLSLSGSGAGVAMFGCAAQTVPGTPTNAVGIIGPTSCTGQHVFSPPATGATGTTQFLQAAGAESGGVTPTQWGTSPASSVTVNGTTCAPTCTVTADPTSAQYKRLSGQPGLGDGNNAIPAGTYHQTTFYNDTGVTVTITGIKCLTDNNGTSTMNVTNGAGTALLTGAITCTTSYAAGTQSGTTTVANGDFLKFTFVSDGTTKETAWVVTETK